MKIPMSEMIVIPLAQFSKFTMYLVSAVVLYASYVNRFRYYAIFPPVFPMYIMLYGVFELLVGLISFIGKKESWYATLIACILPICGYLVAQFASFLNWASGYALQWLLILISFPFGIAVYAWLYSELVFIIASVTVVEVFVLFNGQIKKRYSQRAFTKQSLQRVIDWSMGK